MYQSKLSPDGLKSLALQVSAIHLLTACVMNAPAALAVSKLLYPELGRSKLEKLNDTIKEKPWVNFG